MAQLSALSIRRSVGGSREGLVAELWTCLEQLHSPRHPSREQSPQSPLWRRSSPAPLLWWRGYSRDHACNVGEDMAPMGGRNLHRIRACERGRSPRGPFRNDVPRRCDRLRVGSRRFEARAAVVRIHVRGRGLLIGADRPRPPDHPSSATPGFHFDAGVASDRGHNPSARLGEARWHGVLLHRPSRGDIGCHLGAECLPEVWPPFPSRGTA